MLYNLISSTIHSYKGNTMKKKNRRQKNEELKRRYEAVKNLMSTFAMSTIAVVAVVTLVPASPKAEIIKTVALSDEIVYQVNVTDEDNALDLDTLIVVLENQLEYYEHPIELGENSGFFDALNIDTEYRISIYGNKGFGAERLDTKMITTKDKIGSTILLVTPVIDHHHTMYQVDVSTYDPDNIYTKIELFYEYKFEEDSELEYSSIQVTSDRELIELFDVFTSYPFHIYIKGTKDDGEEILDEIWITPPFLLSSSIDLAYLNNNEIAFHAYGDMVVNDMEFKMNIYRGNHIIKTSRFTPSSDYHDHNKWIIDELLPDTNYLLECIAIYTNPQTLRQEETVIYSQEHTTAKDYNYTYAIESYDTFLVVTITLHDPDNVLTYAYYETYDTTEEFDIYLNGESAIFELDGEVKTTTLNVVVPITDAYKIHIGLRSTVDPYVNQIIELITKE